MVVTHSLVIVANTTDGAGPAHMILAGLIRIKLRFSMCGRRLIDVLCVLETGGVTHTPLTICNSGTIAITCIIASIQEYQNIQKHLCRISINHQIYLMVASLWVDF